jgi:hypothetical protein
MCVKVCTLLSVLKNTEHILLKSKIRADLSNGLAHICTYIGVDKATEDPARVRGGEQRCTVLKYVVGPPGLHYVLLTKDSILDLCYEMFG